MNSKLIMNISKNVTKQNTKDTMRYPYHWVQSKSENTALDISRGKLEVS